MHTHPSPPQQPDSAQQPDDGLAALGERLRVAREALSLSVRDVEALAGVPKSVVARLEQGSPPKPGTLKALAQVLDLDLAELYRLAGYDVPQTPSALPTFTPYLRSKYADLPPAAQAELQRSFTRIAKKHGYDPDGPAPGEDEREDNDT